MKKSFGQLLVLLTLTPFLVQCASQDEVRTLSYQLRAVNKKLEDMQSNTVGDIQKKQANSSGQLTEMQQEILALKGELEATALNNRQLQEQNKELESSIQGMVSKNSSETDTKITQINEQLKQHPLPLQQKPSQRRRQAQAILRRPRYQQQWLKQPRHLLQLPKKKRSQQQQPILVMKFSSRHRKNMRQETTTMPMKTTSPTLISMALVPMPSRHDI